MSRVTSVKLLHVAGARPNFMKVAPIMAAVDRRTDPRVCFSQVLVHTGQHYDDAMSAVFFRDLDLPAPHHHLGVGCGSHAQQTAEVLLRLEPVLVEERPDLLVAVGDVNSTLAAALCAAKLHIPVAHVEAGLRSGDRSMPEELNRLLTDQLADLLLTTSQDADENLIREGIEPRRIHLVGNTMIDTLERLRGRTDSAGVLRRLGLSERGFAGHGFALLTMHRPTNVDGGRRLARLATLLAQVAQRLPVVFPLHARTRSQLTDAGLIEDLGSTPGLTLTEPLGYLEFLALMSAARLVLTDSGGIQEETTVLGVPCLTLRTTTERPLTITEGTNRLVDPRDEAAVLAAVDETLALPMPSAGRRPYLWDGHAAERIADVIAGWALGE